MIGIYKFENLTNGNCYIGQSVNIEKRYKDHLSRAKNANSSEYNSAFHRALRKYGVDNFSFVILEECDKSLLNKQEEYWIAFYNSYEQGYNETPGGNQQEVTAWISKELVDIIKQNLLNSQKTYEQLHNEFGISIGRISEINTGKYGYDKNLTYPLRSKKQIFNFCKTCGVEISKGSEYCIECAGRAKRTVERPSREELKRLIRSLPFTVIGKQYGISDNGIKKWCDNYKLPRTKKEINQISDKDWEIV